MSTLPATSSRRPLLGILLALLALLAVLPTAADAATRTFFVSTTGTDSGARSGNKNAPFASVGFALARSTGGETIKVAPGTYGSYVDKLERTRKVLVTAQNPKDPPFIVNPEHWGGQFVEYRGVKLSAVYVGDHPSHAKHASRDITIDKSQLTSSPGTSDTCVSIRYGASDVTIKNSVFDGCRNGIRGTPTPATVDGVTIQGNVIRNFVGDGIQFGNWRDVVIDGNDIGFGRDPEGELHNDAIQLIGATSDVAVSNNVLHDAAQLLFARPDYGTIDGLDVQNNLMHGARAYAVQLASVTRMRFVNNTVWNSKHAALLLRPEPKDVDPIVPTDSVVANNVLSGFRTFGVKPAVLEGNAVADGTGQLGAPALDAGYRLSAGSSLCRAARSDLAPRVDLMRKARAAAPSVGALECSPA